jgi:hypothetical protein
LLHRTPYKFCGAYSSMLESLSPSSPVTVSQLGRFPPVKDAPRAPVEDDSGTLTVKDPTCMATAAEDDVCFTCKSNKGAALAHAVELAKQASRCAVCGPHKSKGIAKGTIRFRYVDGGHDKMMHAHCATSQHLPSMEHLEKCIGFGELSVEKQEELRRLEVFRAD